MQTTYTGQIAERAAAEYLVRQGFRVIVRNWRRRDCEIDIVAYKDKVMHFVEVKYRMTDVAGSGLEYVTPTKLKRMRYAAQRWVTAHAWRGQYVLSAIEIEGTDFAVATFVECIVT